MRYFDRSPEEIEADKRALQALAKQFRTLVQGASDALDKGDVDAALTLFSEAVDPMMESTGFAYEPGDATHPYQKEGAADAAQVVVQVAGRVLDPQRDRLPVSLHQLAQQGRYLRRADVLATCAENISARLSVVANPVYDDAREGIIKLMDLMQPKVDASLALQREVAPVNSFLKGRFEKTADTREKKKAIANKLTQDVEGRVAGKAREEGRKETAGRINDLLSDFVKKDKE